MIIELTNFDEVGVMTNNKKNRITVEIYGQQYTIIGSEPSEHIRFIAHVVNDKMKEIHATNLSLDSTKVAVLTAVNATHENIKMQERITELEHEIEFLKSRG